MPLISSLDGLLWLLVALVLLMFLQRGLHREIQAILLITTRHPGVAMALFSLIFLPGVLLHELSHYIMARILGVQTGRFSILPRSMPDGRLQMGYVETASADLARDSLIGAAPLVAGGIFLVYASISRFDLFPLWEYLKQGQTDAFFKGLQALPSLPGFYIWFWLAFTVSSTMLPSTSDRRAWLPLGLMVGVMIGLALLAGAGPWMLKNLAPYLNTFLRSVATLFALSAGVHLILMLPLKLFHALLTKITGIDME